jgi:hypothetical protein
MGDKSMTSDLVERFRELLIEKYSEYIEQTAAEEQLRELAELVRMTTPKQEVTRNARTV